MFAATALRRAAAAAVSVPRRPIRLVTSSDQCQAVVERLLSSGKPSVAVDCEGIQLGRFGRLSLVQLATEDELVLVDVKVGGPGVVEVLTPLLESREIVKVFHDCREDASLLLHQHSVALAAVFDTQVAHALWLERKGLELYQASLPEVLRTFLMNVYRSHGWAELERKPMTPTQFQERPLPPQAIRYAVEGVAHLLPLQRRLCRELGDSGGDLVVQRSLRYVQYAHLNSTEFTSQDISHLRPGAPLTAMLAARRPDAAYFKLNHGALTGAVLDRKDLSEFQDLQPGDVAACRVKSLSECQQFVHLQREGHGELLFDFRQREMRRLPSRAEVDRVHPPRQSSMYGFGTRRGGSQLDQEPESFREEKASVIYKKGKRGQVKVRETSFKSPKKQSQQRSFSGVAGIGSGE